MWLASATAATCLTIFAAVRAYHSRVKVWLSNSLNQSRTQDAWPPNPPRNRPNQMRRCLALAGIAMAVAIAISGFVIPLACLGFARVANGPVDIVWAVCAGLLELFCLFGAPFLILGMVDRTNSRIGAVVPEDCWHKSTVSSGDYAAEQN
jgi:hypothetical protein